MLSGIVGGWLGMAPRIILARIFLRMRHECFRALLEDGWDVSADYFSTF